MKQPLTSLFNEFRHPGVDFSDPRQVAAYDARQKTDLAAERDLVARLGIKKGDVVVEFGPGTGGFAIASAEKGGRVTGFDVSTEMIRFAEARAAGLGLPSIRFLHGGFLNHDFGVGSADFVVSKFALHHLPDFWKQLALRRLWHLLKPGGKLYLQDVVFSFSPDDAEWELGRWVEGCVAEGGFTRSDFEMHIRDEYSTFAPLLEVMLRTAGFRICSGHSYASTYGEYLCERSISGACPERR